MSTWSLIVSSTGPKTIIPEYDVYLKSATLGLDISEEDETARSSLEMTYLDDADKEVMTTIVTLSVGSSDNRPLTILLQAGRECTFHLVGPNTIHILGYSLPKAAKTKGKRLTRNETGTTEQSTQKGEGDLKRDREDSPGMVVPADAKKTRRNR